MSESATLRLPGFSDPVHESQAVFRCLLAAMSSPAEIVELPSQPDCGAPLSAAATAILLTLTDLDTTVWLDKDVSTAASYFAFHCGCRLASAPEIADFAVYNQALALDGLERLTPGTDERPDSACSLIVDVPSLSNDAGFTCTGPGIDAPRQLALGDIGAALAECILHNHDRYPQGIDMYFTCGSRLVAVPRSTRVS